MFSALRQGAPLYILDKSGDLKVNIGHVENISAPKPMYNTYNPTVSFGTNIQTVVDIVVKIGDNKTEISGLPSNSSVHSYGNYVVSETREAMISEVDAMLHNSKSVIESIDKHKANIIACENILKQLNPVYAKEKEREDAIDGLTERVNNILSVLNRLESFIVKTNDNN